MVSPQPLPSGNYRVVVSTNGKRKSHPFKTLEAAQEFADSINSGRLTFAHFAEYIYKHSSAFTDKEENTRLSYISCLKRIYPKLGRMRLDEINGPALKRFRETRAKEYTRLYAKDASGNRIAVLNPETGEHEPQHSLTSNDTIRAELSLIEVVLREAVEHGYINSNPAVGMKRPSPNVRTRGVEDWEYLNLMRVLSGNWELPPTKHKNARPRKPNELLLERCRYLAFHFWTVARGGELAKLPLENVDIPGRRFWLDKTKNGQPQWRMIPTEALQFVTAQRDYQLSKWKDRAVYLFSADKDPTKAFDFGEAAKCAVRYGITGPGFHSHANRREGATSALGDGVSLATAKAITGHSNAASLGIYNIGADVTPTARAEADAHNLKRAKRLRHAMELERVIFEAAEETNEEILVGQGFAPEAAAEISALDAEFAVSVAPVSLPSVPTPQDLLEELVTALKTGALTQAEVLMKLAEASK
nr:site-specific integrase [Dechloromonas sp.]